MHLLSTIPLGATPRIDLELLMSDPVPAAQGSDEYVGDAPMLPEVLWRPGDSVAVTEAKKAQRTAAKKAFREAKKKKYKGVRTLYWTLHPDELALVNEKHEDQPSLRTAITKLPALPHTAAAGLTFNLNSYLQGIYNFSQVDVDPPFALDRSNISTMLHPEDDDDEDEDEDDESDEEADDAMPSAGDFNVEVERRIEDVEIITAALYAQEAPAPRLSVETITALRRGGEWGAMATFMVDVELPQFGLRALSGNALQKLALGFFALVDGIDARGVDVPLLLAPFGFDYAAGTALVQPALPFDLEVVDGVIALLAAIRRDYISAGGARAPLEMLTTDAPPPTPRAAVVVPGGGGDEDVVMTEAASRSSAAAAVLPPHHYVSTMIDNGVAYVPGTNINYLPDKDPYVAGLEATRRPETYKGALGYMWGAPAAPDLAAESETMYLGRVYALAHLPELLRLIVIVNRRLDAKLDRMRAAMTDATETPHDLGVFIACFWRVFMGGIAANTVVMRSAAYTVYNDMIGAGWSFYDDPSPMPAMIAAAQGAGATLRAACGTVYPTQALPHAYDALHANVTAQYNAAATQIVRAGSSMIVASGPTDDKVPRATHFLHPIVSWDRGDALTKPGYPASESAGARTSAEWEALASMRGDAGLFATDGTAEEKAALLPPSLRPAIVEQLIDRVDVRLEETFGQMLRTYYDGQNGYFAALYNGGGVLPPNAGTDRMQRTIEAHYSQAAGAPAPLGRATQVRMFAHYLDLQSTDAMRTTRDALRGPNKVKLIATTAEKFHKLMTPLGTAVALAGCVAGTTAASVQAYNDVYANRGADQQAAITHAISGLVGAVWDSTDPLFAPAAPAPAPPIVSLAPITTTITKGELRDRRYTAERDAYADVAREIAALVLPTLLVAAPRVHRIDPTAMSAPTLARLFHLTKGDFTAIDTMFNTKPVASTPPHSRAPPDAATITYLRRDDVAPVLWIYNSQIKGELWAWRSLSPQGWFALYVRTLATLNGVVSVLSQSTDSAPVWTLDMARTCRERVRSAINSSATRLITLNWGTTTLGSGEAIARGMRVALGSLVAAVATLLEDITDPTRGSVRVSSLSYYEHDVELGAITHEMMQVVPRAESWLWDGAPVKRVLAAIVTALYVRELCDTIIADAPRPHEFGYGANDPQPSVFSLEGIFIEDEPDYVDETYNAHPRVAMVDDATEIELANAAAATLGNYSTHPLARGVTAGMAVMPQFTRWVPFATRAAATPVSSAPPTPPTPPPVAPPTAPSLVTPPPAAILYTSWGAEIPARGAAYITTPDDRWSVAIVGLYAKTAAIATAAEYFANVIANHMASEDDRVRNVGLLLVQAAGALDAILELVSLMLWPSDREALADSIHRHTGAIMNTIVDPTRSIHRQLLEAHDEAERIIAAVGVEQQAADRAAAGDPDAFEREMAVWRAEEKIKKRHETPASRKAAKDKAAAHLKVRTEKWNTELADLEAADREAADDEVATVRGDAAREAAREVAALSLGGADVLMDTSRRSEVAQKARERAITAGEHIQGPAEVAQAEVDALSASLASEFDLYLASLAADAERAAPVVPSPLVARGQLRYVDDQMTSGSDTAEGSVAAFLRSSRTFLARGVIIEFGTTLYTLMTSSEAALRLMQSLESPIYFPPPEVAAAAEEPTAPSSPTPTTTTAVDDDDVLMEDASSSSSSSSPSSAELEQRKEQHENEAAYGFMGCNLAALIGDFVATLISDHLSVFEFGGANCTIALPTAMASLVLKISGLLAGTNEAIGAALARIDEIRETAAYTDTAGRVVSAVFDPRTHGRLWRMVAPDCASDMRSVERVMMPTYKEATQTAWHISDAAEALQEGDPARRQLMASIRTPHMVVTNDLIEIAQTYAEDAVTEPQLLAAYGAASCLTLPTDAQVKEWDKARTKIHAAADRQADAERNRAAGLRGACSRALTAEILRREAAREPKMTPEEEVALWDAIIEKEKKKIEEKKRRDEKKRMAEKKKREEKKGKRRRDDDDDEEAEKRQKTTVDSRMWGPHEDIGDAEDDDEVV